MMSNDVSSDGKNTKEGWIQTENLKGSDNPKGEGGVYNWL